MADADSFSAALVEFFRGGCKAPEQFKLGFELEHFIVGIDTGANVNFSESGGAGGLMEELAPLFPVRTRENGRVLALSDRTTSLSLEPGGQLEISVAPCGAIAEIEAAYMRFRRLVDPRLLRHNSRLETYGYLPVSSVRDIELLPKQRYRYMDAHFRNTGRMGLHMMRGTAACHAAIDYGSEADFVDKVRCATLLGPILAFISSNSPVFEGEPNRNALLRTQIWRSVDTARTRLDTIFDASFGFRKYAEFVLGPPLIFRAKKEEDALLHCLSLVFPDVRLRQYIEIRVADSMPIERALAYLALVKGLFADMPRLKRWLGQFEWSCSAVTAAQDALMARGARAVVYGKPIAWMIDRLTALAGENLDARESDYLKRGLYHAV